MDVEPDIFSAVADEVDAAESRLNFNQDLKAGTQPRPLHNARKPAYELQSERPEHRIIIMMKAAGLTNAAIALAIGKTPVHVATIVKQPWAAEQILREVENAGREPVLELVRETAMEATETIIDIMRTSESDKVRLAAASTLIDRTFGKATTPITLTQKSANELGDEELARIAGRAKQN